MASLDGSQGISTSEVGPMCLQHGSSCLPQPSGGDLAVASLLFSLAVALFEVFSGACGSKILSHECSAKLNLCGFFAPAARCCHRNGHSLSVLCCHHQFLRSSLRKKGKKYCHCRNTFMAEFLPAIYEAHIWALFSSHAAISC